MTLRIDGNAIAAEIEDQLNSETEVSPRLEIIQVGDNPASETYVEEKLEACERVDFEANLNKFSDDTKQEKLVEKIKELNTDNSVHGVLVQLPLPEHIDNKHIFNTLLPQKDVDGLTPLNLGKTLRGEKHLVPCSVRAIEKIIEHEQVNLKGKRVTIINNSNLIGKPLSMVLTNKGATVTLCHEDTENLGKHTREADIVITATGEPGLLEEEMITEDSFVIDAGYEAGEKSESEKVEDKVSKLSPEPGGVGPITVAMTLKNLLKCYRLQN
jgi:methylenetetrahydrofolate dehydrogenase (NADP+)/methenyltetrahydrofolate cyclohydrolase